MNKRHQGFTLVEISIVLAIFGLLAGGIVGVQTMLKSQRVKRVGIDATNYLAALHQFKLKYSYYPGDFPDATALWGRADGVAGTAQCAAPNTNTGSRKTTCNGNGDGYIAAPCSIATCNENFRVWEHLEAADMIVGPFTGIYYDTGSNIAAKAGVNSPLTPIEETVFLFAGFGNFELLDNTNSTLYQGDYRNGLGFGGATSTLTLGPALYVADVYGLDVKYDDGKPALGNVRISKPSLTYNLNCASSSTLDAEYSTENDTARCNIFFMNAMGTPKNNVE